MREFDAVLWAACEFVPACVLVLEDCVLDAGCEFCEEEFLRDAREELEDCVRSVLLCVAAEDDELELFPALEDCVLDWDDVLGAAL